MASVSKTSTTKTSTRTFEAAGGDTSPISSTVSYTPVTKSRQSFSAGNRGFGVMGGAGGMGGGSGSHVTRTYTMSYGSSAGTDIGNAGALAEAGVKNIVDNRSREKKDMQDLNSRFANYIEKNRFLEAQLKSVEQRLKDLQNKWGKETEVVKTMYEAELKEARDLYTDVEKEKAKLELKIQNLEDQLAEYKRRLDDLERMRQQDKDTINRQNQQLADYESELNMLRRRINGLEQDLDHERSEVKRLQDDLFKTIQERDLERLNNIDLSNQLQAAQEELEFLKKLHEQELNELRALINQDTYKDNRKFWESEMSSAIRELQNEFDKRLDAQTQHLQGYYQMKVQEVKTGQAKDASKVEHLMTETKRMQQAVNDLRGQISDLEGRNNLLERQYADLLRQHEEDMRNWDEEKGRYESEIARLTAECEKLLREMEFVMDHKLSLELEIAAYRKLLEVEENRLNFRETIGGAVETMETTTTSSSSSMGGMGMGMGGGSGLSMGGGAGMSIGGGGSSGMSGSTSIMSGQMSQKTTFQRSAKGPLAISQVDNSGLWVEVENTGRKDENIGGWKISRKIDGKTLPFFTFPEDTVLGNSRETRSIKVYAQGKGPAGCLEYERDSWGTGQQVTTSLVSPTGEDKATHVAKTSYAGNP